MPLSVFATRKPHGQLPHGHFAVYQEPQGIFLTNCFPSSQLQACTGPWDYTFPSAFDFLTLFSNYHHLYHSPSLMSLRNGGWETFWHLIRNPKVSQIQHPQTSCLYCRVLGNVANVQGVYHKGIHLLSHSITRMHVYSSTIYILFSVFSHSLSNCLLTYQEKIWLAYKGVIWVFSRQVLNKYSTQKM